MKVRIKKKPRELEIDGMRLDNLLPGTVRDVSSSLGWWLIAQGYADAEMRQSLDEAGLSKLNPRPPGASRRRRRSSDA